MYGGRICIWFRRGFNTEKKKKEGQAPQVREISSPYLTQTGVGTEAPQG